MLSTSKSPLDQIWSERDLVEELFGDARSWHGAGLKKGWLEEEEVVVLWWRVGEEREGKDNFLTFCNCKIHHQIHINNVSAHLEVSRTSWRLAVAAWTRTAWRTWGSTARRRTGSARTACSRAGSRLARSGSSSSILSSALSWCLYSREGLENWGSPRPRPSHPAKVVQVDYHHQEA